MSETGQKRPRGAFFVGAFPIIGPFGIFFRAAVVVALLIVLYLWIISFSDGWYAEPRTRRLEFLGRIALFLREYPAAFFGPFGLLLVWDTVWVWQRYRRWRDSGNEARR
ncbi:hypothetical protein [Roseicyclus amphidinii]|uniref:hypothetical protein n=1 Tax=Roseicyclus amphidinii TaxID=3034232 RepID=UPI0024E0AEA0|nr:hypothetical protein [Roseicyclus sp. Amp-Y-6]